MDYIKYGSEPPFTVQKATLFLSDVVGTHWEGSPNQDAIHCTQENTLVVTLIYRRLDLKNAGCVSKDYTCYYDAKSLLEFDFEQNHM